ncbi:MAG: hypothetical protein HZB51_11840 [Chloroflexi bacterium]|nr:hypothetical protein [Chloroflexota bacterium]
MKRLMGWLFDAYAQANALTVWLIDEEGMAHRLTDRLRPSFFVSGTRAELHQVCEWITRAGLPVRLKRAERRDLFARHMLILLEIQVLIPSQYALLVHRIHTTFPSLTLYNADLSISQFYFFERNLFPLAYCEALANESNVIVEIHSDDSRWALDYGVPPLRSMVMQLEGGTPNPNRGQSAPLEITYNDRTYQLPNEDERTTVEWVNAHLTRCNPDVIITRWGDSFILPRLVQAAQRHHLPLHLNRDPNCRTQMRPARSYFSYGRIVHKTMSHTLFGRWHIDLNNAFILDYDLEGAVEVARLTQQPMQQVVRVSSGTGISAMQVATAYHNGYLIPYQKSEPEEFKTARDLLTSDKGGLTYQPITGLHFDVAELDFASMYPAIMARYNVSPETIHCSCCPESRVPEIGYSICRRERGLVPETLAPLIQKRLTYKKRLKQTTDVNEKESYRRRASAQKWLLVTCFGYLGYKNARFGKIEAHEAVTAYGREMLLRAKDLVEERGFRVLHMLTDSLWIQKPGTSDGEYELLTHQIERTTDLPIELEAIYKWVAFLPSRVNPYASVPNRYFGAKRDAELKIRGIEARRGDTPAFIRAAQIELLEEMAQADSRVELAARLPRLLEMVRAYEYQLRAGQVALEELAFTFRLSRAPQAYVVNNLNAIVAREFMRRGVQLEAGESIQYVVTNYRAKIPRERVRAMEFIGEAKNYDAERYVQVLARAVETILTPLGINATMLTDWQKKTLLSRSLQARVVGNPEREYWGPLFEDST